MKYYRVHSEDIACVKHPIEVKAEENLRSKSLKTISEEDVRLRPCRLFDFAINFSFDL